MLKWCSYCQQFMQEIAPYDDFNVTHGICLRCESLHGDALFTGAVVERANVLGDIFQSLFDAARREDMERATRIVDQAIAADCRPVDILMGMIAPMLCEIGEEWKRGALSVAAEHRFTALCDHVVGLVEAKMAASDGPPRAQGAASIFLMNAPGNQHLLGVRILSLWLTSRGAKVRIIDDTMAIDALLQAIGAARPRYLLISMAVTEQFEQVAAIVKAAQTLPRSVRPDIIVGGYPVKAGLVQPIPSAHLLSDISTLQIA